MKKILYIFGLLALISFFYSCLNEYTDEGKYNNTQPHFEEISTPILAYQDNEVNFKVNIENIGLRNTQESFYFNWITNKGKMKNDTSLIQNVGENYFSTNTLLVTGVAEEYVVQICIEREEYIQCWEYEDVIQTVTSWPTEIHIIPDSTTFDLNKTELNLNVYYTIENIKISDDLILIPDAKIKRGEEYLDKIGNITPLEQKLDSTPVAFNFKVNGNVSHIQDNDKLEIEFKLIDKQGLGYPNEIKPLIINLKK